MAHVIKSIVNQLSKAPFDFTLNVLSFNSLQPLQLLQILSDVLCEIEGKGRVDIVDEAAEKLALRLLTSLQILQFKPGTQDPKAFQDGLMKGDGDVVHPMLHWLLQRRDELKKRAYLSRFLLRIDIPAEMNSDIDVVDLLEQYQQLIGEFKQVHKQWDASQTVTDGVSDLRKDLLTMEDDREVLVRRIERNQRKMENVANYHQLLSMAKTLRTEKEKKRDYDARKEESKATAAQLEGRRQRLQQQLTDTRQANAGANSKTVLQRVEDAVRVNHYLLSDKLPKDIRQRNEHIAVVDNLLRTPDPSPAQLQQLLQKIEALKMEIADLTEKRALKKDPTEDGVALYRQQSLIVARKKENSAEELNELRQELQVLQNQLQEKKEQLGSSAGATLVTAEQLKSYVSDLRAKSNIYKQARIELNDLKAEYGILSRTLEILNDQQSSLATTMNQLEIRHGVHGFRETREELERISDEKALADDEKTHTLEQISHLVRILNTKIAEKKATLAPLLRELRPLRHSYQESLPDYQAKKGEYDAQVQMIENTVTSVTDGNNQLENEMAALEERLNQLNGAIDQSRRHAERAAEEMKLYVSGNVHDKGKSVRDQLQQQIGRHEKANSQLQQEHDQLKEHLPQLQQQLLDWRNIHKIFEAKQVCLEREKRQEGTVRREKGRETLVLH